MKSTTLNSLSADEQHRIHILCNTYTYQRVTQILALPLTEGGLGIKTSKAALCRYVTKYNSSPEQAEALGQIAHAVLLRSHSAGQDVFAAVITILQQDILHRLSLGTPVDSLLPQLRLLHRLHLDLFRLDKWKTAHAAPIQKELEEITPFLAEETETPDCEILDPPPAKPFTPEIQSPEEEDLAYLDPAEGRLWPDQAPRTPLSPSEPATEPTAIQLDQSKDQTIANPNIPSSTNPSIPSAARSTHSTENPRNSTNSTRSTPTHSTTGTTQPASHTPFIHPSNNPTIPPSPNPPTLIDFHLDEDIEDTDCKTPFAEENDRALLQKLHATQTR